MQQRGGTKNKEGPRDVLLGRGRPFHECSGNQRVARIVDLYQKAMEHLETMCLSTDVVQRIQELGGRFLQRKPAEG
jgi:hypothetical protein